MPLAKLHGLAGLWQFLIERSRLRAKIELERQRNQAYADHRDHLPYGTELVDYEDNQGRGLWIRVAWPRTEYLDPRSVPAAIERGRAAASELPADDLNPNW
jgi:hypothetical protein